MKHMIDMHIHTTASDGSYSPSEVVSLAKKARLLAIAITDHDTTDGIDSAVAAGFCNDMEVVPGVEISIGGSDDIHILGFFIDHKNNDIIDALKSLKDSRLQRNKEMILKLQQNGFDITYEEIVEMTGAKNVGRLHIAQSIQKKGLVNDYRKIFKKYIISGGAAYVPRIKLGEREGIEAILKAKGLPFLAHINYIKRDNDDIEKIVCRLKGYGLAGLEAMYSGYDDKNELFANSLADKYELLKSGGTDFHGTRRRGVYIGIGRGNMSVPYSFLQTIKEAYLKRL